MSNNSDWLLVDILVRLSRNWHICKSRFERRRKERNRLSDRIDRQLQCLDGLTSVAHTKKQKRCMDRLNTRDDALQRDDDEFHDHPFPDFVARIARWSGVKTATIRKAAAMGFSGYPKVVTKLRKLDGSEELQKLYRQLAKEHPAVAETIRLQLGSPDEDQKPKRRGRPKADYETIKREAELAADWKQAQDSGTYKAKFAKDRKMTVKEFDKVLNRVSQRKRRSDK